ncbi:MAG TPA: hypothetical protein VFL91_08095 [Thermomicrobiales bacterium]|nr:hypothetical protein [Thermomicrobiales bacterium]
MTTSAEPSWLAEHGRGDAIRIVPLHLPGAAPAPGPPPQLTYRGGPLIQAVEVFTVFWGAAWQQSPQDALAQRLNQFFDTILTSALIDQLAEYDVGGQTIGHGRRIGTTTLTAPTPRRSMSDTALQRLLNEQIAGNAAFPQPTANTLYFLYLPPGTTVTQGGSRSCQAFCGYHNDINGQIFYAVMPYPGCAGCVGGLAPFDALTSTSSHELCEAITDPVPGQGWYDDTHGEVGDICAWQTKQLAGYTVQLEWSNRQGACV